MQPLVSICIPTKNRCEYLKQTIESIVTQKEFKDGRVEIVISDNLSLDGTEEISRDYSNRYPNIKYYKNEYDNVDLNFPLSLSRGTGILRKLNNDTFVLNEGSLKKLCNLVEKYEKTKPAIFLSNGILPGSYNKCQNFENAVTDIGVYLTWITCFTIWEDDCAKELNNTNSFDVGLWQVDTFLRIANKKDKIFIFNEKIGNSLPANKIYKKKQLFKIFHDDFLIILNQYYSNGIISKEKMMMIEKKILFDFFTYYLAIEQIGDKYFVFDENDSLKHLVIKEYAKKEYWPEYKIYYKKAMRKFVLKQNLKKILPKKFYMFFLKKIKG